MEKGTDGPTDLQTCRQYKKTYINRYQQKKRLTGRQMKRWADIQTK
jgi:hypothetical protein